MQLSLRGFTLLEVLITLIVLAVGMLGLANLQSKVHTVELESYQRAHAVLLLQEMADRISTNRANAAAYITASGTALGTGDAQPADCTALAVGVARDQCDWSNHLKGAAEKSGTSSVGAMIGARGCVEQIQAINATNGSCQAGIYRVSVAWQGLAPTVAPSLTCGVNQYTTDSLRRLISTRITVGVPGCS